MNPGAEDRGAPPTWFLTLVTLAILFAALWYGRGLLVPLAIAGLLFILSSALVDRFKRIRIVGRRLPGWLANLLGATTIITATLIFGMVISSSAEEVQEALPKYQERLSVLAESVEGLLGPELMNSAESALHKVDLGSWAATFASGFTGFGSTLGLVLLYVAFLTAERAAWIEKLPRLVSSEAGTERVRIISRRIAEGVKQYMWVNTATSAMSGGVAYLIFSAIDLDFAGLLAVTVFAAGFIPNIGAFIAITLPSLVALIQFDDLMPFLIVLFGYGLADQVIANVIQPSLQGKSLNLSTFMVMVSLTYWATVWGGIGAFLAIPMTVVAMVVCAEISGFRWIAVLLSADGKLSDEEPGEEEQGTGGSGRHANLEDEIKHARDDFDHGYD